MQELMNNAYFSFALIVVGFGFLIFVHELGHFLVAKMVGIKTTQFAIGFGHSLLTWRKGIGFRVGTTEPEYEKRINDVHQAQRDESAQLKDKTGGPTTEQADRIAAELGLGETEYRLNYIPLGGYVKMLGQEDMDPTARSEDPRAFNNKSVSARFAVISAGVIMNIIFGMIFFAVAFMSGVMFPPATVGGVIPGSPANITYAQGHEYDPAYQGLLVGDRILRIDGKPVDDILDVKYATILAGVGSHLSVDIERGNESDGLTYNIMPKLDPLEGFFSIGVASPSSIEVPKIKVKKENEDLVLEGLTEGMRITEVDGQPVADYRDYDRLVIAARGREASVTFTHPKSGDTVKAVVTAVPQLSRQMVKSETDQSPQTEVPQNLLGLAPPVMVLGVAEESPAEAGGMLADDLIARIGSEAWPDVNMIRQTIKNSEGKPVEVSVWRDGQEVSLGALTPKKKVLGFSLAHVYESAVVGGTIAGSPLDTATKIIGGSKLLTVNGRKVENWADIQLALETVTQSREAGEVTLTYELNLADRPQESLTVSLTAEQLARWSSDRWLAPMPRKAPISMLQKAVVGDDPMEAVSLGFKKTHQWITNTYMTLYRLTQGTVPADKLSGPVGIVHQGTIIAERGWEYLLFFLGLISINLAVINFLPIPITDGGQAVFLIAEKIKGSPVSVRIQTAATVVGLALLLCVFLFVTYNDLTRLLSAS